jgi:hypothetical protein
MKSYLLPGLGLIAGLAAGCTSIRTQVTINAPVEKVRSTLYAVDQYPTWNPFIVKLSGPLTVGQTAAVTVQPVGKDPLSGTVTYVTVSDTVLAWKGGLAFPGLYSGRHEFVLEAVSPTQTVVHQNERMSGAVIPFFNLGPTQAGFVAMNEALKARVEK